MTDTDTNDATSTDEVPSAWHPTACILCECNCGIEIRLGADGRTFERTRGDKAHPASKGYTCEKALRLDHYQNGRSGRITKPLRRRPDGTFEEIDWDTAIAEVAVVDLDLEAAVALAQDAGGRLPVGHPPMLDKLVA